MKSTTLVKIKDAQTEVGEIKKDFDKPIKQLLKDLGIGAVYRWVIYKILSKPKVKAKFEKIKTLLLNVDEISKEMGL